MSTQIIEPQDLKFILELHRKWVVGETGGQRADLTRADLTRADLYEADLTRADLNGADLTRADLNGANLNRADLYEANLTEANLTGANLTGANLAGANLTRVNLNGANLNGADLYDANLTEANLTRANLTLIIEDFYKVLDQAKLEVPELYKSLWDGRIDGSQYEGECACLVGTIANVRRRNFNELENLKPDSNRFSEKWFLAIQQGDSPLNSVVSKITAEWMETYMEKNEIKKPIRTVSWS